MNKKWTFIFFIFFSLYFILATADLRADLFNNSFLLLTYIGVFLGDQVCPLVSLSNFFFDIAFNTFISIKHPNIYGINESQETKIHSLFFQVFIENFLANDSSFFTTWYKNCTKITSRKMYSQSSMDTMLGPIPTSHHPQNKYVLLRINWYLLHYQT